MFDSDVAPLPGEDPELLLAQSCQAGCGQALQYRAKQELEKPDQDVIWSLVFSDLTRCEEAPDQDDETEVRALRLDAKERLRRFLTGTAAELNERRLLDLHMLWNSLDGDGVAKPTSEVIAPLVAAITDGRRRGHDLSYYEAIVRMSAPPGTSEAEIQAAAMKTKHAMDSEDLAFAQADVGPNELCPCDSGLKFKKCHGIYGRN